MTRTIQLGVLFINARCEDGTRMVVSGTATKKMVSGVVANSDTHITEVYTITLQGSFLIEAALIIYIGGNKHEEYFTDR